MQVLFYFTPKVPIVVTVLQQTFWACLLPLPLFRPVYSESVSVCPKNLQENVNRTLCLFLFTSKRQRICALKSNKAQINIH